MAGPATEAHADPLPVDATLRRVAVIFRILGWAWMVELGIITIATDEGADKALVLAALGVVSVWTGLTWFARRSHRTLSSSGFVIADGVVGMAALAWSPIAGAENLFYGGYPMSWLGVAAYAWGFRGAVAGSVVLSVEQGIVEYVRGRGAVPVAASVTFIVFAVVAGWGFSALRVADRKRLEARARLAEEHERRVRFEERANLANRLHDSVLQTLVAIRREPADASQVRYLARRQERELRNTIDVYRSPYEHSLRATLLQHSGEIEDLYGIEIDVVLRGDAAMEGGFAAAATAAREALINAAKHSGCTDIDVYGHLSDERVEVYVRDRGTGFDPDTARASGLLHSMITPVTQAGGHVSIISAPGSGTEVVITIEKPHE